MSSGVNDFSIHEGLVANTYVINRRLSTLKRCKQTHQNIVQEVGGDAREVCFAMCVLHSICRQL